MQSISECFDEYHKRWRRVEHICGFQVCSNPSSPTHKHTQSSTFSSHNIIGHNYNSQTYFSSAMSRDLSTNSIATYVTSDGVSSLRHGSASSGEMPTGYGGVLHRSSTLPRFRGKSSSIPPTEADSSSSSSSSIFYQQPKSRSSSVSSSSTSSGSQAFLRSYKSGGPPPLVRQQSTEGDVDIADCIQFVGNQQSQHVPSQIQHHQLHLSSVSPMARRPEVDATAEPSEGPADTGQAKPRPPLKTCASLPVLQVRKDSYHEAMNNGGREPGGGGGSFEQQQAESTSGGGITFTTPGDSISSAVTAQKAQLSNETKLLLKSQLLSSAGYRATSLNTGLGAIKEERASQISLTNSISSGSGDSRSGSASVSSRASSSSPDKPKVKGRSLSPRATTLKGRNHRSISSDV